MELGWPCFDLEAFAKWSKSIRFQYPSHGCRHCTVISVKLQFLMATKEVQVLAEDTILKITARRFVAPALIIKLCCWSKLKTGVTSQWEAAPLPIVLQPLSRASRSTSPWLESKVQAKARQAPTPKEAIAYRYPAFPQGLLLRMCLEFVRRRGPWPPVLTHTSPNPPT
ncbi:hypothetical protein LX32DRAFT_68989 [Colletotrichum zoysiae]|uniref:Uncharacterized protein n=1 Tax=Colletotrichum zoysiae TaxID=1216348 RepID=A0AAD9HB86_9PEZI|nr:hypothetical protein LX32DRAFT_68989 [Colletotrichum zoysiae]